MIGHCAGGCGAIVSGQQCFCRGCQWTITQQYGASVVQTVSATKALPKIGFTTDPYFQMAGA